MTDTWAQLLSSSMVGTQRRPCRIDAQAGPLSTVLSPGDVSERLLDAGAAVTLARRAGHVPQRTEPPAPAPPESQPYVPPAAAARLATLLTGAVPEAPDADRPTVRALLGDWLDLAATRGRLVPPDQLVPLADAAARDVALRQQLGLVGGARWQWLRGVAGDRWRWTEPGRPAQASQPDPRSAPAGADVWQTGDIEQRAAYLSQVRAGDPVAARELLADTWAQERAVDLAQLIEACAIGIGPDDEPWLEKALDDRRVQIRQAAAALLGRLSGSAYSRRMTERALACVRLEGRRIAITLPAEYDAGLQRDAVVRKPPHGVGERAWWLKQIVAAAPLDCWTAPDTDPSALLGRKVGDDFAEVLHEAWAQAAAAQGDIDWAVALCRAGFGRRSGETSESLHKLIALLPAEVTVDLAVDAVRRNAFRTGEFLNQLPRPWPAKVAKAVLEHMSQPRHQRSGVWWTLLQQAHFGLDPACLSEVRALISSVEDERVRPTLTQLADILQIRSDINREFA